MPMTKQNANHHATLLSVGTGSPDANSPALAAWQPGPNLRFQTIVQNQHASAVVYVYFGSPAAPPRIVRAGETLSDESQDSVFLRSDTANTPVLVDSVH